MNPMKERKWMFVFLLIMINIVNASEKMDTLEEIGLEQVLKKYKVSPEKDIMSIIMQYVCITPTLRKLRPHSSTIGFVLLSFDQRTIYSSDDKNIYITNSMTGECLQTIDTGGNYFHKAAIAFDDTFIVTYDTLSHTYFIYLWDIKKGFPKEIPAFHGAIDVTIFNKNTQLAILGRDNTMRIWDLPSNQEIQRLPEMSCNCRNDNQQAFCMSPDSQWIVSCSNDDNIVGIWDIQKNKRTYDLIYARSFDGLDISKDGRYIAVFTFHTIKVYKRSISRWKLYTKWEKLEGCNRIFFTCDYLVSVSEYTGSYEVWSLYTNEHRRGKLPQYSRAVSLCYGFLLLSGPKENVSVDRQYNSKFADLEKFVPEGLENFFPKF